MRRSDRGIPMEDRIKIVEKCKHCRIGLPDDDNSHIVLLNYGYSYEDDKLTLYFHSAKEGRKVDIIRNNNNRACLEIDCDTRLIEGKSVCDYGYEFRSIIGFGYIILLETDKEKSDGLNKIIQHQTGKNGEYTLEEKELQNVLVFKMDVEEFTSKERVLVKNE